MTNFAFGMVAMGFLVSGLFFLRFWRKTRERLFAIFAVAFWMLAINWFMLGISGAEDPHAENYLIRLAAFVLIIAGIIDKNRSARRNGQA